MKGKWGLRPFRATLLIMFIVGLGPTFWLWPFIEDRFFFSEERISKARSQRDLTSVEIKFSTDSRAVRYGIFTSEEIATRSKGFF